MRSTFAPFIVPALCAGVVAVVVIFSLFKTPLIQITIGDKNGGETVATTTDVSGSTVKTATPEKVAVKTPTPTTVATTLAPTPAVKKYTPTISIFSMSTGSYSPPMVIVVHYSNMPATNVRIRDSLGKVVWTELLTEGGSGSTVLQLPYVLEKGLYRVEGVDAGGTIYATSAAYQFSSPDTHFDPGSPTAFTLAVGQSATDGPGGIRITFNSVANNDFGQPAAYLTIVSGAFLPGGNYLLAPGERPIGMVDALAPSDFGTTIGVYSISPDNKTVRIIIGSSQKG